MSFLRRSRRPFGQTTTEYMLMISVISLALMIVLTKFSDPDGPVQKAGNALADGYEKELDNSSGEMKLQ